MSDGTLLFDNVADRIDNHTSPVSGLSTPDALRQLNPGLFILELPGAAKDQGVMDVKINVPDGVNCPEGTSVVSGGGS